MRFTEWAVTPQRRKRRVRRNRVHFRFKHTPRRFACTFRSGGLACDRLKRIRRTRRGRPRDRRIQRWIVDDTLKRVIDGGDSR